MTSVLFVGSKDRGVACLRQLVEDGTNIVGVVTQSTDDTDRFWGSSVEQTAKELTIPVYSPNDINDPSFFSTISDLNMDIGVLCGYNQIVGSQLLQLPDEGFINLHAGKLPEYRGGSPMNWAIINGEETITATIHYATERVDAGDILAEATYELSANDTIEDVRQWTLDVYPNLLSEVVTQIVEGEVSPRPFDTSDGAYWGSRKPQDGFIRWNQMTAEEVHNLVRALTKPYPGAFTWYGSQKLFVWETELIDQTINHVPGRVCMPREQGRIVAAADQGLLLKTVQPENKDERSAKTYLTNGEYLK